MVKKFESWIGKDISRNKDKEIVLYYPTEKDKIIITALNNHIIDTFEPLSIEQKAFALAQLVSSFEDVSGIKFEEIITSYKSSQ